MSIITSITTTSTTTSTTSREPTGSRSTGRSTRRSLGLLLLPLLALGLFGTSVAAGGVARAETVKPPGTRFTGSVINGTLTIDGVHLKVTSVRLGPHTHATSAIPEEIYTSSHNGQLGRLNIPFSYTSDWGRDAEVDMTFDFVNTRWKGSAHFFAPANPIFANTTEYSIQLDGAKEALPDGNFSYTTSIDPSGYSPKATIKIIPE